MSNSLKNKVDAADGLIAPLAGCDGKADGPEDNGRQRSFGIL